MSARRRPEVRQPAERDPVARLAVDVPLAHLDRPFDYLVPDRFDRDVTPGVRVRVRFAGQLVDAVVLERVARSDHPGRLSYLERVVSPEPVLSPQVARLARAVADRWAGTLPDVLRLALPPRHARAEAAEMPDPPTPPRLPDPAGWSRYAAGDAWLGAIRDGRPARAVWSALPGEDWPARIAEAAGTALSAGRGAVAVVPDRRDLDRLDAAFTALLGPGRHVSLSADLGPAERYRRWLAVRRGRVRAAVGVRAAAFAPVADLGLLVVWDDGDDLHAEPRAPYPHARDLLVLRAHLEGSALLVGGFARTAEAQVLVGSGWAPQIVAPRERVRAAAPRVVPVGDDDQLARDPAARTARLPTVAWQAAREALGRGAPVLVQVPRRGYLPSLACLRCRAPARCPACQGPLAAGSGRAVPACRWCGRLAGQWRCPVCQATGLRAAVVGATRTAEELGRAFPGVALRLSGGEHVLDSVPAEPALVVSTPGAEPTADGGYGAALLLDGWALLARPDLRATEETLRRWMNAAALVRPAGRGGRVVVVADGALPVVQSLLRWDPAGHAARELDDRVELGFPPATRMAGLTGTPIGIADLVAAADLPDSAEPLGPVPAGDGQERLLVRVPRADGAALAAALHAAAAVRSARKAPDPVRIRVDPLELF
ncbi:MAG TPA: primosomal protein N' [Mycobacteriales bacterium]|nr:primosomal protein N' [Mycobacteriales bacterium]